MSTEIALAIAIVLVASSLLACCFAFRRSSQIQQQFQEQAQQVGKTLAQVDKDLTQLEQAAHQYPPEDPEPYGPDADDLDRQAISGNSTGSDRRQGRTGAE